MKYRTATVVELSQADGNLMGEVYRYLTGDDEVEDMSKTELFRNLKKLGVKAISIDNRGWSEPVYTNG